MISSNKILFFGTPEISKTILESLLTSNCEIVGIVTNPDRPSNRGKIVFSPVKQFAIDNDILLFQPERLKDFYSNVEELKPTLIITCAYGKIIPENILNFPIYKAVNIHTSLLPKYRGAAPIHYAVLNGDKETGVTLMYMDKGMDTGNIIFQESIQLSSDETYSSLYNKLGSLGAKMISEHLDEICSENVKSFKQDESKVTFTKKIEKEDEEIDWNKSAVEIERKVRGLYDAPIAFTTLDNNIVKIHKCILRQENGNPGQILNVSKEGILVSASEGSILITILQLSGKRAMTVKELLNGNHIFGINKTFKK